MNKINFIREAIEKADLFKSKLTDEVLNVPFLGSLKIRALLNNLGAISTRFLEIGSHKGGSCCSTIFDNHNLKSITVIDSWQTDLSREDKAYPQFMDNFSKYKPSESESTVVVSDCWEVDLKDINTKFDLYSYDADHTESDQCKALTYYYPVLADEFIYCCDDYGWAAVKAGTQRGIKEMNLEILFDHEFVTHHEGDNESWWNGFYIALLKKK